jgi:phosphoglycolate phosphatase-like HAD superfamily hydrolase
MPNLVLFDIDGTLVLTGGAGLRAMTRAFERVVGHARALEGIPVAGRTDWIILSDAVRRVGGELDHELFHRLRDEYLARLREEIELPGHGVKAVMPGVRELLARLHGRDDVWLGLLTGNFVEGARIKLEHFDLWKYFRCGAFGDDAADRNLLVPYAVERARQGGLPAIAPDRVLVVGDTPHDVACALAAGAVPVGVATGGSSVDDLRRSGADIVFEDLSDAEAFCTLLTRDGE